MHLFLYIIICNTHLFDKAYTHMHVSTCGTLIYYFNHKHFPIFT